VILSGQLAVSLFDGLFICIPRYAQNLVIVFIVHKSIPLRWSPGSGASYGATPAVVLLSLSLLYQDGH
jgi:hypothetical protein